MMTETVEKKIGAILFGCLLLLVGGMFLFEYAQQGHVTLKGGTVIRGTQALVVSLSLLFFGAIYSLIALLGKHDATEKTKSDKGDKEQCEKYRGSDQPADRNLKQSNCCKSQPENRTRQAGQFPIHPISIDNESKLIDGALLFESGSSYDFIEAAEALKQKNIFFESEEEYAADFNASRRAPPPYIYRIYVSKCDYETAMSVLSEKGLLEVPFAVMESPELASDNSTKFYVTFILLVLLMSLLWWFYKILAE